MNNREKIFDIYATSFASFLKVNQLINPSFVPKQENIIESIRITHNQYSSVPEIELTEEEQKFVINKIESIYSIFQEEGSVILGDYEHDYHWYDKLLKKKEYVEYYWPRYKSHLLNTTFKDAPNLVDVLENSTLISLMSYLGNPNDESSFSNRGLVVGDVQSGKTSNYLGLLTKAADAGYKVIFILTGTIESLRKQTQQRVEEGFVGFDSVEGIDVGVGRGERTPKAFTSRAKDFIAGDHQNTTYKISDYSSEPMIFVVKKNVSVLKKIYASLKKINTTLEHQRIDYSMMMVDDEADNASINTNKQDNDPTKINKYIRSILSLFTRTSYIGFTATPFANVFISYDTDDEMLGNDLFPRDFIYALNAPSNYCGSREYFLNENSNVYYINDANQDVFPIDHKKEWQGTKLYESVYHALNSFFLANAIRDIRDVNKKTHRSMLINMSRFTMVQWVIKEIVEEYFKNMKNAIKQTHKLNSKYAISNPYIYSLYESFRKEYSQCKAIGKKITWEDIILTLYDSVKDIRVVVVNSSKNSEKLNYDDYKNSGLRVIAIGGLALSRGLTLEGLSCSYFYRNTSTFDVLMQMGRWFGYRSGYEDLCRIFITKESTMKYFEIYKGIEQLKKDIKTMGAQGKKPSDYGIRVRNASEEMKVTAANKMRNTKIKIVRKSFFGTIFETPYLHRDLTIIKKNVEHTIDFLKILNFQQKDLSIKHPYFRNISKEKVVSFLSFLNIHEANDTFDIKQLTKFIGREDIELSKFDVLVIGGSSDLTFDLDSLNIHIKLTKRSYDFHDFDGEQLIRISGKRAHLWGPSDTQHGLTKEQIKNEVKSFESNPKAQDYLIKGRNPLLIIYLIDLKNNFQNTSAEDIFTLEGDFGDFLNLSVDQINTNMNFVVGYAIGFPMKDGETSSSTEYTVNKTVNYYDKEHIDSRYGEDE